jgi:hypothetical protein
MTLTRERSTSPDPTFGIKRFKTCHGSSNNNGTSGDKPQDYVSQFASELFDHNTIAKLRSGYLTNEPFKFAVVEKLFQDDLLKNVKDECLSELSFSQKETDIYKVCSRLSFTTTYSIRNEKLFRSTKPATLPHSTTSQHLKSRFYPIF